MSGLSVAFRVDASMQMGTGHFMRCLTLANALAQRGASTRFVSRQLPEHLHVMLTAKGHEFRLLAACSVPSSPDTLSHSAWLGTSQASDARASSDALGGRHWDWLVADHYALDARWESALRPIADRILVIDDLADRQHDCDALLDQNYYRCAERRYLGKTPAYCQLMLGPRFALLRDEFRRERTRVKLRTGLVQRVLLFFGGVDSENFTGRALAVLLLLGRTDLHVDVVIGAQHPSRGEIESECARHGYFCHVQTNRMADLMAAADLAIGAGGSSTWERFCVGVPTLALGVAANQHEMVNDLLHDAYLLGHPDGLALNQSDMLALLRCTLLGGAVLRGLSERGLELVDGAGGERVARYLTAPLFDFRRVTLDDTELLYAWRNHPDIRAMAHQTATIDGPTHAKWLSASLADPSRHLLIAQAAGVAMGVVRFDIRARDAFISVYFGPDYLHMGMGAKLLRQATAWLRRADLPVDRIVAEVRAHNKASLASFGRAGYVAETYALTLDLGKT